MKLHMLLLSFSLILLTIHGSLSSSALDMLLCREYPVLMVCICSVLKCVNVLVDQY